MPTCVIFNLNGIIIVCMYESLDFLELYSRSANVFRDGYSFRNLLCNAISKESKSIQVTELNSLGYIASCSED